jgi:hypothetical protein
MALTQMDMFTYKECTQYFHGIANSLMSADSSIMLARSVRTVCTSDLTYRVPGWQDVTRVHYNMERIGLCSWSWRVRAISLQFWISIKGHKITNSMELSVVAQRISIFYRARRFITVFTSTFYWSLTWARWIHSVLRNHISVGSILQSWHVGHQIICY